MFQPGTKIVLAKMQQFVKLNHINWLKLNKRMFPFQFKPELSKPHFAGRMRPHKKTLRPASGFEMNFSREILQETKSIFFSFVWSPPKTSAKITSKYGEDLFFWSSLKLPSVFASNLTRNSFLVLEGYACAACLTSVWSVPQKVWAFLV